jgi:hypothetical protein
MYADESTPEHVQYLTLSENSSMPTRFAAGPFIAGEEISFDKLYYSYNHATSVSDVNIWDTGEGSYFLSDVVFLVNYDNELSEMEEFPLLKLGDETQADYYPATKITESLNFFRGEFDNDGYSQDYFYLSNNFKANTFEDVPPNTLYGENDFFLGVSGGSVTRIKTGADSIPNLEPIFYPNTYAGRLLNLGIVNGPRVGNTPYNIQENIVEIAYQSAGGVAESDSVDILNEPLSGFRSTHPLAESDPTITRGFTNVAGRYQVRLALQTTETTTQYFEVNFDILPSEPNFNCSEGECSDLRVTKPQD